MRCSVLAILYLSLQASAACDNRPLENYQGRYQLGECMVEMHLCEQSAEYMAEVLQDGAKFLEGDLLVKHVSGKTLYVPIYSSQSRLLRTKVWREENDALINYNYNDINLDPVSGVKERFEVSFFKRSKRIELRMKNSVESRKNPLRSLFFPNVLIVCDEND